MVGGVPAASIALNCPGIYSAGTIRSAISRLQKLKLFVVFSVQPKLLHFLHTTYVKWNEYPCRSASGIRIRNVCHTAVTKSPVMLLTAGSAGNWSSSAVNNAL